MKRLIICVSAVALLSSSFPLQAEPPSQKTEKYNSNKRVGEGALDSTNKGMGMSMLGWGIGLAAGITLLSSLIHQSKAPDEAGGGPAHAH